ncbi:inhibitor of Bruton tyrosine kinase [Atheta coriaria]|uniref:inhibitor of Bruton tyrosine kinase n=1 Tax=Dalotia coriaria TaxID=877792 RepID=UPI0031F34ED2
MANLDIPCTKFCNRKEHGDFIVAALTKRAVNDIELSAFLNYTCVLCGSSKDVYGRTSLHMAASCGRTDVCKWLVCQKQAKIDEKDTESGYTALHRSIFYGKIDTVVALIQLGGNLKLLDSNDLTPLDHAMLDNLSPLGDVYSPFIYVWGSNTNYTLGPNQSRHHPEAFDSFHKTYPLVEPKEVYLEKFHTLILSKSGEVYSFGHGQGGRLGVASEKTILEPTEIKFTTNNNAILKIISCAIGRDHSLFLTDSNEVWSCGSNTHHVLGIHPPPAQLLTPRHITKLKTKIEGIACGRYHSVAWNQTSIFTWGYNGGQLGHDLNTETSQIVPKSVNIHSSQNSKIISVAASVGATAIATNRGDVYILHEYQCRMIASKILDIISVSIYGGKIAGLEEKREDLRVLALTKTGNILVWQETDPQLCRCTFSLNRLLKVRQVCLNAYGLVFITDEREVFNGKFKARKKKTIQTGKKHFNHFLERTACVTVQIEKVPRIYGANSVVCDAEGHNFAAIHLNTSTMITVIPEICPSTMFEDFAKMINNTGDVESDVTFKVGSRIFPAHRYILRASSDKLSKMEAGGDHVVITNVEPEIFHEIIQYAYTGTCSMLKEGPIPQELAKFNKTKKKINIKSNENNSTQKNKSAYEVYSQEKKQTNVTKTQNEINDPLRLLQEAAKKLGINSLYKDLNLFEISAGSIKLKNDKFCRPRMLKYNRADFPELHDVRIKATCGSYVEAHKCILAARSEFFSNMFSMRWLQSSNQKTTEIELPSNIDCIRHLIDYLYTDQVDLEQDEADQILSLLILADHILLDRLVEVCEFAVSKLITIKNVLRLMTIADMYNSTQLKETCMEYACLNLALLLETRHLEQLDDELLKDLTKFYENWNAKMHHRVITPYSDAVCDKMIAAVSAKYPVKMDFNEIISVQKQKAHRRRNRTHRTSSTSVSVSDSSNLPLEVSQNDEVDFELSKRLQEQMEIERSVPVRIKAISRAHERINDVFDEDDFVNLSLASAKEFPDLSSSIGSPPVDRGSYQRTPKQKGKMTRLSQKERKRLTSESSPVIQEIEAESPKNPWNMNFETSSPVSSHIGSIITEEKKQRENLSRIKSKLLIYTQIEDKALDDLKKFYNVDNVFDEVIEISRVDCGQIAAPLWIQK